MPRPCRGFVKGEKHRMLAALGRRDGIGERERRLAYACRADEESVGAALEAAAEKLIQVRVAAGGVLAHVVFVMLAATSLGKILSPPVSITKSWKPPEIECRASSAHASGVSRRHFDRELLQENDAMDDRMKLQVVLRGGEIVEKDNGAVVAGEKVL